MIPAELYPTTDVLMSRSAKEERLGQRAKVFWLYGLSGSGKTTLAAAFERRLHEEGLFSVVLDGDNVRSGLNKDLGFSDEDRSENIRRIAEAAKLFVENGVLTIVSFITPRERFRRMAREIVGENDFLEVYAKASYETCEKRDVKGLYAKANAGKIRDFTGQQSNFEEPSAPWLVLDTEVSTPEESLEQLWESSQKLVLPSA
ncbi:MAG: adenylyl-sulfate kinase [Opitutae bacterium]|nr:adenylyl-sulfate kinase [Opitutae bacterium]